MALIEVNISDIKKSDRLRKLTPSVWTYILEELAPSLEEHGMLSHPIVDEDLNLIAGECRIEGWKALGNKTIIVDNKGFVSEDERGAMEIEENLRRRDMTWQEYVKGIAAVHRLKSRVAADNHERWGLRQTGKLVNLSHGRLSDLLPVADYLNEEDEDVMKAKNMADAINVILLKVEDKIEAERAKRALGGQTIEAKEKKVKLDDIDTDGFSLSSIKAAVESHEPQDIEVDLGQQLIHGDCIEAMSAMPEESFDIILTDIPYGIEMGDLEHDIKHIDKVKDEHDVESNIQLIPDFLNGAYKVLKSGCYCIFYYDLCHHEKIVRWALEAGFSIQDYPLIWCKSSPCKNRSANKTWTKAHETAFVCWKGDAVFHNANYRTTWKVAEVGAAQRRDSVHPFIKAGDHVAYILDPIATAGARILDPFAGEGSILRECIRHDLEITGIELSEVHYPRLVANIADTYRMKHKADNLTFVGADVPDIEEVISEEMADPAITEDALLDALFNIDEEE